jgi:hypothetical protein
MRPRRERRRLRSLGSRPCGGLGHRGGRDGRHVNACPLRGSGRGARAPGCSCWRCVARTWRSSPARWSRTVGCTPRSPAACRRCAASTATASSRDSSSATQRPMCAARESRTLGLDRNELGALLVQAGLDSPRDHALISLLAMKKRLARRAGITERISPHSLRHSFITAALDAGVPLRDVQEAASHADPRTTMRYDRPASPSTVRHLHRRRVRRRRRQLTDNPSCRAIPPTDIARHRRISRSPDKSASRRESGRGSPLVGLGATSRRSCRVKTSCSSCQPEPKASRSSRCLRRWIRSWATVAGSNATNDGPWLSSVPTRSPRPGRP